MSLLRLLPLAAVGLLASCSVLPERPPIDTYLLPAATIAPAADAPLANVALRVTTPGAGRQIRSSRIVVIPADNRLSVYQGAAWSDPAPVLVRNRLLDAFRADGRIASLSNDDRALHADFELDSELAAFQSEYRAGVAEIAVTLNAALVEAGSRRIVASRHFDVREAAPGTALPQIVGAFGKAGDRLAAEVVEWTVQQIASTAGTAK